ncbi:biopolymer transporter ExbD [Psychromonas sp. MME2]|uniref:ExbD/TolR family protein n=1 Tax=unclassified Psychromonas TaxID=2614957 RepID=UPI00339C01F3
MKLKNSRTQQAARIELLPLIDVIFLLLIFFIFVMLTMTMRSGIKVDLPQLVEQQQQTQEMLTISIDANNAIYINDQPSNQDQLIARVIELQKAHKLAILIRGDKRSDLGVALTILDKLRSAGFDHVIFATEKNA